jgi:hypothetical protein
MRIIDGRARPRVVIIRVDFPVEFVRQAESAFDSTVPLLLAATPGGPTHYCRTKAASLPTFSFMFAAPCIHKIDA